MKIPFGFGPFGTKKKKSDDQTQNGEKRNLFEKVRWYFDPTPQKEKVLRHEDFNAAGDTYYAGVSVGYKIAQRLIILIMVLFLVVSLISNFKDITYDNFFYLMKDFSNAVDIESSNYDTVSYSSNPEHFFALYRGGIAVANPSNISVFTATGRKTLDISSTFSSPCIEASEKYILIYDTAGTSFSVYNSFSRIYSETLEYPITAACFAENGYMAIVSRDISHKSLVHVYNEDMKRRFTVPSGKLVFDVEMNDSGELLAISYYSVGDGSGLTEISVRSVSNTEELGVISIEGEFLLKCGYLSGDRLAVITDRSVRIYNSSFEEESACEYIGSDVTGFSINEFGAAVSYIENSKNVAVVFDNKGELIYNETVFESINDISLYDKYIFLRTDSGIVRVNTKDDHQQYLPSDQGKMLIYNASTALVCGESKAEYLVFEDK